MQVNGKETSRAGELSDQHPSSSLANANNASFDLGKLPVPSDHQPGGTQRVLRGHVGRTANQYTIAGQMA